MRDIDEIMKADRTATDNYLDKRIPKDSKEEGQVNPHLTKGVDGKYRNVRGEVIW